MPERNLDFDTVINRQGTKCLKYDFAKKRGYPEDVLPLWVADMDFKTSSYIEDALKEVCEKNIYGYTNIQNGDGFFEAVSGWMKRHHDWEVKPSWHVSTPGVVFAIATAVRALTKPNDHVLIQQPVYYPFENAIKNNGRIVVSSDLVLLPDGRWVMDPNDLEEKIVKHDIKLFILCNPHNPVGRVWSREELSCLGKICKKHGVTVFSDEIHFDFIWKKEHNVFCKIDPSFEDMTITATSASKTFNLAGLQQSNIFIPNRDIKRLFEKELYASGYDEPGIFAVAATLAAYSYGEEWYEAMMKYVRNNIEKACEFINEKIPGVSVRVPEGTYLLWLDFNKTLEDDKSINDILINRAKLWLDAGHIFGKGGRGFQRINAACPQSILFEALKRIQDSFYAIITK
ncbi:MAG: pyridoxal phosphate-dependent aminotransferase [Lachnospiraceae bacterium]|nr:pyridoxal phosphate-dependent aminotransferase [Lachnospiraceae bacterium]